MIVGSAFTAAAYGLIAVAHGSPLDMLLSAALMGVGIGLSFAALGNLIVQAVEPQQTGAAGGMNTVMRTIGGAIGGQLSATFIAGHLGRERRAARHGLHRDLRDGDGVPGRLHRRGLPDPGRRRERPAGLDPALGAEHV